MNTSLSWIKAYVPDLDVTAQEYTDAMTLSGTKVEGYEKLDADLDKIVVGQIEKIEKHPDADKLIICQVNIGSETIQIVTGAPNVHEGDKVPVVLDGGRVAGGHEPGSRVAGGIKIKKGKLRGVESCGMMCSIEELGSNRDMYPDAPEEGIYIFPEDTEVGADAVEVLGLGEKPLPGVANIGTRPTVAGIRQQLEVHLLDVAMDLYGRHIQVVLRKKIRNEQRFASLDELKAQIARDELTAREFFGLTKPA